jgi:FKBP-type peptidyl-prolyl cis-trans isomerase 2
LIGILYSFIFHPKKIRLGGKSLIKKNAKVSIHYTLKVDGKPIISTEGESPLTYTHGGKQVIPGLEDELEGLKEGDKKVFSVPPEKAFGQPDPNSVRTVSKNIFDDPDQLTVDKRVEVQAGGKKIPAIVVNVGREEVTLDLNHPLAGKTLDFSVEVVGIR